MMNRVYCQQLDVESAESDTANCKPTPSFPLFRFRIYNRNLQTRMLLLNDRGDAPARQESLRFRLTSRIPSSARAWLARRLGVPEAQGWDDRWRDGEHRDVSSNVLQLCSEKQGAAGDWPWGLYRVDPGELGGCETRHGLAGR